MITDNTLEFYKIKEQLAVYALTDFAKQEVSALEPTLNESECKRRLRETTEARKVLDTYGSPPLTAMKELDTNLELAEKGAMLSPGHLLSVVQFLKSCKRMKAYLKKAQIINVGIAFYGESIHELDDLISDIENSIRDEMVLDSASSALQSCRRKLANMKTAMKVKLDQILRGKKEYFADSYVTTKGGRFVLPVKREYKNQVSGSVIEISNTGSTYFIEPSAIQKLQDEVNALEIEEENEIIKILYTLTAFVDRYMQEIKVNMNCMQTLDFHFAKAKLSAQMEAVTVPITTERKIIIKQGRHPLLNKQSCIPLDFEIGSSVSGVIITGPNTGGKTVALKTVGLLSLMAQSGLHVPVAEGSLFCMNSSVLCDIGDGQSISENLSTFSAHIKNVIEILKHTASETLVLLDELGSGTDPAEGMGLAVSILEELLARKCLFIATTHYPEVKDFAHNTPRLTNARMAFDRESLKPLYKLQIGEAGESCAFHIAQRLGFPVHMLKRAFSEAYGDIPLPTELIQVTDCAEKVLTHNPRIEKAAVFKKTRHEGEAFNVGDSVLVYPQKENGIVFKRCDAMGMLGVQIKKQKQFINHKRVKLVAAADTMYPDDYDFSIIFESVENRKARHQIQKHHSPDKIVTYEDEK